MTQVINWQIRNLSAFWQVQTIVFGQFVTKPWEAFL